jgi:hypothetical protein
MTKLNHILEPHRALRLATRQEIGIVLQACHAIELIAQLMIVTQVRAQAHALI